MKKYDFEYMKEVIENEKYSGLLEVEVGMEEDWSWTAETVWTIEDYYDLDIFQNKKIAGISGSRWATPIMILHYKNGRTMKVQVFYEEGPNSTKEEIQKMKNFVKKTTK